MRKEIRVLCLIMASAFLLCLFVKPVSAGIHFGIKGGLTLGNIKTVPDNFMGYKWQNKRGLAGGIFMEVGLPGPFSIQPEVLYVQKGARVSFTVEGIDAEMKVNVDYIEIPLLLKVKLIPGGLLSPSVYAGPYVGFMRKAEAVISALGYSETEDIKDQLKDTDYGITFGLGLSQSLGVVRVTLDARYDFGIPNIMKIITEDGPESVKTRTWLFLAGISF